MKLLLPNLLTLSGLTPFFSMNPVSAGSLRASNSVHMKEELVASRRLEECPANVILEGAAIDGSDVTLTTVTPTITAPSPPIVIDGNIDDWEAQGGVCTQVNANQSLECPNNVYFVSEMCNRGNCKEISRSESTRRAGAYAHWDCASNFLYVLVYAVDEYHIDVDADTGANNWVKLYSPVYQTEKLNGEFAYIGRNGNIAEGYEAKYLVPDTVIQDWGCAVTIEFHMNYNGATTSTGKRDVALPIDLSCPTDPSPTDPAPSPTDPAPSPTDPAPSPTDPAPSPTDPAPSPTDSIPTPSCEECTTTSTRPGKTFDVCPYSSFQPIGPKYTCGDAGMIERSQESDSDGSCNTSKDITYFIDVNTADPYTGKYYCDEHQLEITDVIRYVDTVAPSFTDTSKGEVELQCNSEFGSDLTKYTTTPPLAEDDCDEEVHLSGPINSGLDSTDKCNASFTRSWDAKDDCGNINTFTQTVYIQDTLPPNLHFPQDKAGLTYKCTAKPNLDDYKPTASDQCTTDPTIIEPKLISPADPTNCGTVELRFATTDECNNIHEDSISYEVEHDASFTVVNVPPDSQSKTCMDPCFQEIVKGTKTISECFGAATATDECHDECSVGMSSHDSNYTKVNGDVNLGVELTHTFTATTPCNVKSANQQIKVMNECDFSVTTADGSEGVNIDVVNLDGLDGVEITLKVLERNGKADRMDLRGIFFNLNGDNDSTDWPKDKLDTIAIDIGYGDVSNICYNMYDITKGGKNTNTDVDGNSVTKVENDVVMQGVSGVKFTFGCAIGTPGKSKDDIQQITFKVYGITTDDLKSSTFGVRATSVCDTPECETRGNSVKLVGEASCCDSYDILTTATIKAGDSSVTYPSTCVGEPSPSPGDGPGEDPNEDILCPAECCSAAP